MVFMQYLVVTGHRLMVTGVVTNGGAANCVIGHCRVNDGDRLDFDKQ